MAITAAKLLVQVDADTSDASTKLNKFDGSLNSIASTAGTMGKALSAAFGALVAMGAIDKLRDFVASSVNDWANYNEEIRKFSIATGAAPEQISRLMQAADDMGVSMDAVTNTFKFLAKAGIEPTIDNIANLSDQLLAMEDPASRAKEATRLFGRSWVEVAPIMLAGGDAIRKATGEVQSNLIATQESINQAREYKVSIDAWTDAWTGFKNVVGQEVMPLLTGMMSSMTEGINAQVRMAAALKLTDTAVRNHSIGLAQQDDILAKVFNGTMSLADVQKQLSAAYGGVVFQFRNAAEALAELNRMTDADIVSEERNLEITTKLTSGTMTLAEVVNILTAAYLENRDALGSAYSTEAIARESSIRLGSAYTKTADQAKDAAEAALELAEAEKIAAKAADTMASAMAGVLQAGLSGALQKAMDDYKTAMAELGPAMEAAIAQVTSGLGGGTLAALETTKQNWEALKRTLSEGVGPDGIQSIGDLTDKFGELDRKMVEAKLAMERATAEMIYQQAAAGLDASAALELARAMGLISEKDYQVASAVANLKLEYDLMDGALDGVITNTEGFNAAVLDLYNQVLGLQAIEAAGSIGKVVGGAATEASASAATAVTDITTVAEAVNLSLASINEQAVVTATETQKAFTSIDWKVTGQDVANKLGDGFKAGTLYKDVVKIRDDILFLLSVKGTGWTNVGYAMMQGIAQGVKNGTGLLTDAIRAAIAAALAAAQAEAETGSPSELFARMVGEPISKGIAAGIMRGAGAPAWATQMVTSGAATTNYDYGRNVTVNANVSSEIDIYNLAREVSRVLVRA